jgi:hypothetical protein
MKNFAKLAIFFSILFIVFFLAAVVLRFFAFWIDLARVIPVEARGGEEIAEIAWKAIPAALYFSVLLALSYTARRRIPIFSAIISVIILASVFSIGSSLAISRAEALRTVFKPVSPIQAKPGLITTQGENSVILLRESNEISGPRLVSIPGRPLIYQEVPVGPNNSILPIPAISFEDATPWFIKSIGIDFSLSAGELKSRFEANFFSFAFYAFSLILLLSSMRSLMEISQWPLANIFLGALVFRLILALETLLNTREINLLLASFLGKRTPPAFITPLVFCAIGILVLLYTLLTRIAKGGALGSALSGSESGKS